MKELFLLRGLPGSGKSTLAKSLDGIHIEADQYFMEDGIEKIVVSNTFTQEWEMEEYYKLADKYGYRVYSLIVENRHGGVNEHGVPADKLEQMKNRFEVKL